ncbi:uncharacterized protein LOC128071102 [Budorcas taxicolor]|uniref:uncharacterized protein LOC128071102 n=1 Tax=Budorcas taxicolor TaxID=37181 RepID=UPI002283B070|nr:uncharacterized protein LOC128071102 [Budorcas taxicolor]
MQQQKRQNQKGNSIKFEQEEWISRLPDEILIRILSSLTVKQAQMTSVLSTRWRYLWTHINCLNFGYNRSPKRSEYIDWVNKVCSSIQSPRIEEFRMISNLDEKAKDNVDKWLDFAMEKRVKDLELVMSMNPRDPDRYIFSYPATFSSYITNKHLRSLNLRYVNISGATLEHFLLHCQSLEQISICESKFLTTLKVGGGSYPLLNLKSLEISYCPILTDLKISAPNLSNFQYQGQQIRLHVENAPLLCHVYIGGHSGDRLTWAFRALSSYLCQLQTLVLGLGLFEFYNPPWIPMEFQQSWKLSSLRELTVRVSGRDCEHLLFILLFLKATPFLEKLRLEMEYLLNKNAKLLEEMTDEVCPHKYLKVLEIIGFTAFPNLVEFVKRLSGAAPKLETVIVDPSPPWKASDLSQIVFTKQFEQLFDMLLKSVITERIEFVL